MNERMNESKQPDSTIAWLFKPLVTFLQQLMKIGVIPSKHVSSMQRDKNTTAQGLT
jgi:hypothetical protein